MGGQISEGQRLAALHALGILDTPPTAEFDAITQAAAQLLSTPIALVSLVDQDRQWFKSAHGLGVRETPRDVSFCSRAIASGCEPLVVPDTHKDPRFVNNGLVTGEPYIRAYAGAPVRGPGGALVGTVCAIDRAPRRFTDQEIKLLKGLSRWVESELVLHALGVRKPESLLFQTVGDDPEAPQRHRFWDMSPDPLLLLDLQGTILDANASLAAFLGEEADSLRARSAAELGRAQELEATLEGLAEAAATGHSSFPMTLRGADGRDCRFTWEAAKQGNRLYLAGRLLTGRKSSPSPGAEADEAGKIGGETDAVQIRTTLADALAHMESVQRLAADLRRLDRLVGGIAKPDAAKPKP